MALIGTVYPADGSAVRRASVAVSEGAPGMRSLARFLYDGTLSNQLNVIERGPGMYAPSDRTAPDGHLSLTSQLVLGAGGLAVAGGAAMYVLSKPDDPTMPTYNDRKALAIKVVVVSSPVLGAGVYLALRDTTSASRLTAALLGAGVTSLVAGTALYLTDEDPDERRKYYRNSAEHGVITGGAGIVLTGVGALLWYRDRNRVPRSSRTTAGSTQRQELVLVPGVSAGPLQFLLGCSGTF
jgi:hypothetical protein